MNLARQLIYLYKFPFVSGFHFSPCYLPVAVVSEMGKIMEMEAQDNY